MGLTRWAIAAAALLAAAPALAGDEVLYGPVPDWVAPVAPAPEDEASTLPIRVLLVDNQQRLEAGRRHIYSSVVLKFQTPQGLSGGNLSFPWRQDSDDLTVHKVLIRRGDEVIDVLAAGQTFTVLRREQNLEHAMLDGVLTANMFPEGLQVGDVLEVATTLVSADPVLAGHSEAAIGPLNTAVGRAHLRLMWPTSARVRLDQTDDLPAWQRRSEDGFEIAELTLDNITPIPIPEAAPVRYHLVRFAEASDFASWAELTEIFVPLYRAAAVIPTDGPLRAEVERIRAASADPVERAEAALELVQSRIRYVALTMGDGGLVPASAAETWARRYGDCKAKTALLLAVLGELGIDAEAVVVNTALGDTVADRLPTAGAFNHVIVRARIGGRDYWLDGTRTGDTSLARLQVPYYDWGLPIRPRAELVRMVPPPLTEPSEDLAIHMDASKGVRAPVPTSIELTLRGDSALATNEVMANLLGEDRDRALREYWRRRFSSIEPEEVALSFDRALGELRMTMQGTATLEWDGVWYETDETRVGYRADFQREPGYASDAPYSVAYPTFERTRQTIVLPFSGEALPEWHVDETVAGIEYKRRAEYAGNTFTVERTARTVAPEFPARDAPAFEKRLRELRDTAVHIRIPNGYRPTEADLAVSLTDTSGDSADLVARAHLLMTAGENDEALALLDRATQLDQTNSWAWANRGIALLNKNMPEEAAASLDRAYAIDPRNWVIFNGRGRLAEQRRDFPAAVAAFSTALELDPGNAFALGHRAMAYWADNKPDLALRDATEAIRRDPKYLQMHTMRAALMMNRGQRDEAAAAIAAMLRANPDNPGASTLATQFFTDFGFRDRAQAVVEQAMAGPPNAMAFYNRARLRSPDDTAGQLADLDEAIQLAPDHFPSLAMRADLRSQNGDTAGALADAEAAIALNPTMTHLHELKANVLRAAGRKDEALAALAALVEHSGDDRPALTAAGRIYASFGLYAEAVAALDKAVAILPEPFVLLDRAAVRDPRDFAGRMADIDEALRKSPNYGAGLAAKADLLGDQGDHTGAARAWGQALRLEPRNPGLLVSRGIEHFKLGRIGDAERDFAEARAIAKDSAAGLNSLCYLKAVAGVALESALEECNASLRLVPDVAATLDSRGAVLLRMGRLAEALRDFDRALELSPDLTPSRYLRAVTRSRLGDTIGAQADLEAARAQAPLVVTSLEREGFVLTGETVATAG